MLTIESTISLELAIINNPVHKVVLDSLKSDILRNRIIPDYVEVYSDVVKTQKLRPRQDEILGPRSRRDCKNFFPRQDTKVFKTRHINFQDKTGS